MGKSNHQLSPIEINVKSPRSRIVAMSVVSGNYEVVEEGMTVESVCNKLRRRKLAPEDYIFAFVPERGKNYVYNGNSSNV